MMPTGQPFLVLWRKAVRCMAGVQPQDDVLPLIRNLKLTHLTHRWSLQLVTTIRRCHQRSAPALLLEKLSFHEHQHGTRGRQQGDFRPFQPVSLAGRISFTNRAPLLSGRTSLSRPFCLLRFLQTNKLWHRLFSRNVVTMETSAIGWPL